MSAFSAGPYVEVYRVMCRPIALTPIHSGHFR
jgi:hypothetical protein